MSRNPYHVVDGVPEVRLSVLAYVDILGYSELIKTSERDGTQNQLLQRLHEVLSSSRGWLEDRNVAFAELAKIFDKDFYALKAFTDNIVLARPIRDDGEVEIGRMLQKLADFQFSMSVAGFFVRGAVSVGNAYVDDIAVFGDALTQAYLAELNLARDPRIVLTETAVGAVRSHLKYYGNARHAPQVSEILCDSDGQWFLNYLDCVLIAENEHGPFYDEFLKHKSAVEAKLSEHKNNPPIFSKYAWVANYHNYFCDLNGRHFSQKHKIAADKFRPSPKLIVDDN